MIKVHIWYPLNTPLDSPGLSIADAFTDMPWPGTDTRILPEDIDAIDDNSLQRYGHGGIEFISVVSETGVPYERAYRAFWPGLGADWTVPSPGRVVTSFATDISEEGSRPTRTITIPSGLNEALVYRYWYSLQRQPLDYSYTGFNCCSSIAVSIRDGFPQHPATEPPTYTPLSFAGGYIPFGYSNPYYLEEWTHEVCEWLARSPRS